jgi:hypothetical protein
LASVLEEKDQIRELLAAYCWHYDSAQFEEWIALWADDPVFDIDGTRHSGRDFLVKFTQSATLVNGKPPMKHYIMNDIIEVKADAVTATAKCYLLVVRKQAGGALLAGSAGTYEDKLVKKNGKWLFAERKVNRGLRYEPLLGA